MGTVISFEIKKFFSRKKNLFGIILFAIFIVIIFCLCNTLQKNIENSNLNIVKANIETTKMFEADTTRPAEDRQYYANEIAILEREQNAILNKDWRETLRCDIEDNELSASFSSKSGNDTTYEKMNIAFNKLLLKLDCPPIYPESSVNSSNFIYIFLKYCVPLALIILLLLFSSDLISSEFDDDTHKLLSIQPISRLSILYGKFIAILIVSSVTFIVIYTLFFFIGAAFQGFGSTEYPIVLSDGAVLPYIETSDGLPYISSWNLLVISIPYILLLIFCVTALGLFISSFFNSGSLSLSAAIIIYIGLYILINKNNMLPNLLPYLPNGYFDLSTVTNVFLQTNLVKSNFNYYQGLIVFAGYGTIFTLLSSVVVKIKRHSV